MPFGRAFLRAGAMQICRPNRIGGRVSMPPQGGKLMSKTLLATSVAALALLAQSALAQEIKVGHLMDLTGATSSEGKITGPGRNDAMAYINKTGGINGKKLAVDSFDYSYQAPRAIAQYKKWKQEGYIAIQGYGTADTEALVGFLADDKMPYYS